MHGSSVTLTLGVKHLTDRANGQRVGRVRGEAKIDRARPPVDGRRQPETQQKYAKLNSMYSGGWH
jgi:hypothetical protein